MAITNREHSSYYEGYTDYIFDIEYGASKLQYPKIDDKFYDMGYFDARDMIQPKYDIHLQGTK